jgi:hypothetical protein
MSNPRRTDARPATIPAAAPRPLGQLADLAALLDGDSARSRRFLGGLVVGALVGAAVAGGSLFRRRTRGGGGS